MTFCPFCLGQLPFHSSQCGFGNVPSAETLQDLEQRKKMKDAMRVKEALNNPNKVLLDGSGGNLRERIRK